MSEYHQPSGAPESSPHYQPPQRSGMPTWAIVLLVGAGLLLVTCVLVAIVTIGFLTLLGGRVSQVFSEINSGLEQVPVEVPVDTGSALGIGETAEQSDFRITVLDAQPLTTLSGGRKPIEGYEYWAVEVEFENISEDVATLSAFVTSVQDDAGVSYPYSTVAQRASPNPGLRVVEVVRPSETARGLLFYEVPQAAPMLFWVYRDASTGVPVVFAIK